MPTTTGQRKRFKREQNPTHRPPLELQERDREIIWTIYQYRFITSAQLKKLIPGSEQGIGTRLQKLYHHGYVDRVKISNNAPMVYAVGNQGAIELQLYFGVDRKKVDWRSKNREVKHRYLEHTLMIGRFRYALELATRTMPDTSLATWEPEGTIHEEVYFDHEQGERTRVPLVPDAYFTLRDRDDFLPFMLECDRSTMTHERFVAKLRGYAHFHRQNLHKQRLDIPGFRVLVVTMSEARKDNLRLAAREAAGSARLGLFWFGCERRYTDNPAGVFAPIWQTAADERWHRVVE